MTHISPLLESAENHGPARALLPCFQLALQLQRWLFLDWQQYSKPRPHQTAKNSAPLLSTQGPQPKSCLTPCDLHQPGADPSICFSLTSCSAVVPACTNCAQRGIVAMSPDARERHHGDIKTSKAPKAKSR